MALPKKKIRNIASSAGILCALMFSTALVPDAQAQKAPALLPVTSWAVKRVGADDGPKYCALARRFNRDVIITVAKNTNLETSVAFDFQKPVFNVDEKIEVILDPGAGQLRNYDVTPASTKALIVRQGQDNSFFAALGKTGFLRFQAGSQSYHFNLADIDQGQFQLDSCVAAMILPAAGEEDEAVDAAGSSYRLEINNLRQKIQALTEENERLSNAMDGNVSGGASVSAGSGDLQERLEGLERENENLKLLLADTQTQKIVDGKDGVAQGKLSALVAENKALKADIEEMRAAAPAANEEQQEKISFLKSENERLEKILEEEKQAALLRDELEIKVKALQEENGALTERMEAVQSKAEEEYAQKIAAIEQENKDLKASLEAGNVDAQVVEDLRRQIARLEGENGNLKAESEAMRIAQENAVQTNGDSAEVSALEQRIQVLEAENKKMEAELSTVSAQAEKDVDEFIESFEAENKELRDKLAQAENGADNEGAAAALEAAQAEIASLKEKNQKLVAELEQAKVNADPVDMAEDMKALKAENLRLASDLEAAREKAEALDARIAEKEEQLAAALKEKEALRLALEEKGDGGLQEYAGVQAELESVRKENAALETQIQDMRIRLSEAGEADANTSPQDAAKIKKLERALEQANAEKQEALQGLAREYIKLKQQVGQGSTQTEAQVINAAYMQQNTMPAARDLAPSSVSSMPAEEPMMRPDPVQQTKTPHAPQQVSAVPEPIEAPMEIEVAQATPTNEMQPPQPIDAAQQSAQGEENLTLSVRKQTHPVEAPQPQMTEAQRQETRLIDEIQNELDALGPDVVNFGKEAQDATASSGKRPQNKESSSGLAASMQEDVDAMTGDKTPPLETAGTSATKNDMSQDTGETAMVPVPVAPPPPMLEPDPANEQAQAKKNMPKPEDREDEALSYARKVMRQEEAIIEGGTALEPAPQTAVAAAPVAAPKIPPVSTQQLPPTDDIVKDVRAHVVSNAQEMNVPLERAELPPPAVEMETVTTPMPQALPEDEEVTAAAPPPVPVEVYAPEPVTPEPMMSGQKAQETADAMNMPPPQDTLREAPMEASQMAPMQEPEQAEQAQMQAQPEQPPAPKEYTPAVAVSGLLERAQVASAVQVEKIERVSGPGRVVYQWQTDDIYGSAEQIPLTSAQEFDTQVLMYLEETQRRCQGDYAVVPDNTVQKGDVRIDSYEVACVGPGVNSTASVLFFNQGGTFTVLAHEASADHMEAAMDIRDRLLRTISGT